MERVVDFWRRHEVAPFSAYLLLLFVNAFGELLPLAVDLFEGIFFSSCHKSVLLFVVVVILRVLFEEEACDEVSQRLHDERASVVSVGADIAASAWVFNLEKNAEWYETLDFSDRRSLPMQRGWLDNAGRQDHRW